MRHLCFAAALCLATPVMAQDAEGLVDRYIETLRMDEIFAILREEGLQSAEELAAEDQGISASPAWSARMSQLYSLERMDALFREGIAEAKNLDASEEALAFFESDLGQRLVKIEIDARRALSDEAVEDAAREEAMGMEEGMPERIEMYSNFIAVNNLVDGNVMGALNSNLAFYQGFASVPQFQDALTEREMLSQVWSQEPDIREDMEDWTMNFSVLAYGPLSDEEMQAYIDISASEAGQVLNSALFAGFDRVFESHSRALGRAMAEFSIGDDT